MSKTILMIHGVGSSADAFVKLAPAFRERGWRVETPTLKADLRRHENPPPELAGVSLSDYVDDVIRIAKRLTAEDGAPPMTSMGTLIRVSSTKAVRLGSSCG